MSTCLSAPEKADRSFPVPADASFTEDVKFCVARDIERIADILIREHVELRGLSSRAIKYLWARKGGLSRGKVKLATCERPSGKLAYFAAGVDFIVTVSADNCREAGLTHFQMEALVYHELSHAGEGDDSEPIIIAHDFEGFRMEIERYGFWEPDLLDMGETVWRQARLPGTEQSVKEPTALFNLTKEAVSMR